MAIGGETAQPDATVPDAGALDALAIARQLIAVNSVNPDLVPGAPGESAIADWCSNWLAAHGFEVHRLEERKGRPSVVGRMRGTGGGASLMLNGHLDTVGTATFSGDAFAAEVRDGRLVGRGAFDMKTGVAAILVAAANAAARPLRGDILVTLVADEEFGSLGTEEVLRHFTADAAIIAEPSGLEMVLAHRGFAWFEVELTGRAAHGSQPKLGVDAIAHAGEVLRALDGLRADLESRPAHPSLGHGAVRVSTISGGADAATVAASCTLTIERRMLPGQTPDQVENEIRELLEGIAARVPHFSYRLTRLVARGAFEADPDWPIVRAVSSSAEQVLGRPAGIRGEPFWTDAGLVLEAGIPCLLLGVDGGGAHADDEWCDPASIHELTAILERTIVAFCG